MTFRLWQLADSAFPTGGFAHSSGLEAALQHGEIGDAVALDRFVDATLWQVGHGVLPLANAAFDDPPRLAALDALCDAFLSNHVANRASRVQGRAFVAACERIFDLSPALPRDATRQHLAPVFGASLRALGVPRDEMQRLLLHLTFRGVSSAAVRLGLVGPYEAQRIQAQYAPRLEEITRACAAFTDDDLAQTAPLLELYQSAHDRLYSRLFQS